MPCPKQRHTKSRQGKRRAHLALQAENLSFCPKCRQPIRPHLACANCGAYNGRQVIDVFKKLDKKEKKKREKEIQEREKEVKKEDLSMAALSKKSDKI